MRFRVFKIIISDAKPLGPSETGVYPER